MTLAVLILLTAVTGASADAAADSANPLDCWYKRQQPIITAVSGRRQSYRRYQNYVRLESSYGDNIDIFCSSNNASDLTIRDDERQLQAVFLNSTTIKLSLQTLDIQYYTYYCKNIYSCTETLNIRVGPVMSVTAPGVHHALDKYGYTRSLYFVPRGAVYNVYCLANEDSLSIEKNSHGWKNVDTKPVNATAVMATVTNDAEGHYRCYSTRQSASVIASIEIVVDYYPKAREFRCVLYKRDKIECSWKSLSSRNTFTLYLIHDQKAIHICSDRSGDFTAGCAGGLDDVLLVKYISSSIFSLRLQTCNKVFCSYQDFDINGRSIRKLDRVDLKLTNVSSLGAAVAWRQGYEDNAEHDYKVQYRLLGKEWRQVNASLIECKNYVCEFQVPLPCPDIHYDLEVYVKNKEANTDYWSEPASVFFFTAPSKSEADPACKADFREVTEKPALSASGVLYEVRQLISDYHQEMLSLKQKISNMEYKKTEV